MPDSITVTFDGNQYIWNGKKWFDKNTFLEPPKAIVSKLDALSANQIAADDDAVTDLDELMKRAKQAQEHGQIQRALKLIRQVHEKSPNNVGAVAMLCSILRTANQPEEALSFADKFRNTNNSPLLTSRAAVLCDLNRWEEGLKQIKQVLAIGMRRGGSNSEALAVYSRIKKNAPELFDV